MLDPVADKDFQIAVVHPDWYLHPHLPVGGADEIPDLVPHTEPVAGLVEIAGHRLKWSHLRDIGHVITGICRNVGLGLPIVIV